ncbi:MAG TPA: hypothetical protein VKQ71_01980 [Acidimicrobiales bacterium]|nr:hypothetical protein [Acidimicrobiales bacterium]
MNDPVHAREVGELNLGLDAATGHVLGDCGRLPEVGVRLGLLAGTGGRRGMGPPVVQDAGDVGDAVGALGQTQHEVIVLTSVKAGLEAAELNRQRAAVDTDVAGVHEGGHHLRRPPGLEMTAG